MTKVRPVVVVSRKRKNTQVVCVVPLSTTMPYRMEACHHEMTKASLPSRFQKKACWAKCDMVCCVSFDRLDRIKLGKSPRTGRRMFSAPTVTSDDLNGIRNALRFTLAL